MEQLQLEAKSNKNQNHLESFRALLQRHYDYSVMDVNSKHIWTAIPTVLHSLEILECDIWLVLQSILQENLDRPRRCFRVLELLERWLRVGKRLETHLLLDIQSFVRGVDTSMQRTTVLNTITALLMDTSPVISRWRQSSPREEPLQVLDWSPSVISAALTILCEPFFRVRCFELGENVERSSRRHVADLTLKFNSTSCFVTMSILFAAHLPERETVFNTVKHWLGVAVHLLELNNFHMAFAIQSGL